MWHRTVARMLLIRLFSTIIALDGAFMAAANTEPHGVPIDAVGAKGSVSAFKEGPAPVNGNHAAELRAQGPNHSRIARDLGITRS